MIPVLFSVDEVDAYLARANRIPEDERTSMWHEVMDALLDRRAALATVDANLRDIRVMRAKELR